MHDAPSVAILTQVFIFRQISTVSFPPARPDRGWRHARNAERKWTIGAGVVTLMAECQHLQPRPSFPRPWGGSPSPWTGVDTTLTPRTMYKFFEMYSLVTVNE